jgi:hypothetical protein
MINIKAKTATALATKLAKGGIVKFSFVKGNGDLRMAEGTTDLKLIPKEQRAKITNESAASSVRFYDLSVKGWRSVSHESPVYLG